MSIASDEKRIFNQSIEWVEATNKRLIQLYERSLENVRSEIADIQLKLLRGQRVSAFRQERLDGLYKAINEEIVKLRRDTARAIRRGYAVNYENTYYLESFAIEKHVNTALNLDRDYLLRFPELNTKAVIGSLDERVAGNTFSGRMLHDQRIMQFRVRQAVSQNIIEGQTVQQLARNLQQIDAVFEASLSKAMTTARTELLTAYSLGQQESVNEAIEAGVQLTYKWSATLDKEVRQTHAIADGKKALIIRGEPIFTVGGVRFNSPRIVASSNTSNNIKREKINCRCYRQNNPYGIEPTRRSAKRADGTWTEVNGDVTAVEWTQREYGVNLNTI